MRASPSPRTRVLYLVAVAVGVFLVADAGLLVGLAVGQLLAASRVGLSPLAIARDIRRLWLFGLLLLLSFSLLPVDTGTDQWTEVGSGSLAFSLNLTGARHGLLMILRILNVLVASQLVRAGDPAILARGLRGLGIPEILAASIDTVLALGVGGGGRGGGVGGGGRGGGAGRGRRRNAEVGDTNLWQRFRQMLRGDIRPLTEAFERQMRRVAERAPDLPGTLGSDVRVISGIALTLLAIKMVKILPSLPFAPGHKMVLFTPLYVLAAAKTSSRWGATLMGLTLGIIAFLLGDGRYGVFEILKHVTPGILCDLIVPPLLQRSTRPGIPTWIAVGGVIGLGRFSTELVVILLMQPPLLGYALVVPGLISNIAFGAISGYLTFHVVAALLPQSTEETLEHEQDHTR
jgi:hypothetical protein